MSTDHAAGRFPRWGAAFLAVAAVLYVDSAVCFSRAHAPLHARYLVSRALPLALRLVARRGESASGMLAADWDLLLLHRTGD